MTYNNSNRPEVMTPVSTPPLEPIAAVLGLPTALSSCCGAPEIAGHCSECREHFEGITFTDGTTAPLVDGVIPFGIKFDAVANFALFFVLGMLMSAAFIYGNDLRIPGVN